MNTLNINHQTPWYGQIARALDSSEDVSKSIEKSQYIDLRTMVRWHGHLIPQKMYVSISMYFI